MYSWWPHIRTESGSDRLVVLIAAPSAAHPRSIDLPCGAFLYFAHELALPVVPENPHAQLSAIITLLKFPQKVRDDAAGGAHGAESVL